MIPSLPNVSAGALEVGLFLVLSPAEFARGRVALITLNILPRAVSLRLLFARWPGYGPAVAQI
jgi:hypothetical protein